ncbi:hypothetical protein OQA88_5136 [Cercophora sp. LCS_1]
MSVAIWPPITPSALETAISTSQSREVTWFLESLKPTLDTLKHILLDSYALLAPIDPGSTLVISTPRAETAKGTITRVGTRIVRGTLNLRLRTLPPQTLNISPSHPIHLAPLVSLHTLLTHSIDLLTLTLDNLSPSSPETPAFLAAQLRLLSHSISEASSLLKGPPLTESDPTWTTRSVASSHFLPPGPHPAGVNGVPALSVLFGIQDGCLVLWLRSLEPADAPVNFGTKLALAIGTTRRLEHDETDKMFGFCCAEGESHMPGLVRHGSFNPGEHAHAHPRGKEVDVFVREKVRVETADPSLLSLASKLTALGNTLSVVRRNLAAVMGEEVED